MLPRLIELCEQRIPVIVNAILPMPLISPQTLETINRQLESAALSADCLFLDPGDSFTKLCLPITKPCFLNDGVHLSTRGYSTWAAAISSCIKKLPPSPASG
jgi:lysophospholipase L1-like esterase